MHPSDASFNTLSDANRKGYVFNNLKGLLLFSLLLLLLLNACQRAFPPQPRELENTSLFSSTDLNNAIPVTITSTQELGGADLPESPATELPFTDQDEGSGDLESQAILANARGFVVLYRKSGTTYQIRRHDQTNNNALTVYSGTDEVSSVAISADGSSVVASIKKTTATNFDVYLFDIPGSLVYQLTTTGGNESNVSMTRTASKIAWQRPVAGLQRPFICTYNTTTHTCSNTSLSDTVNQIQPSLSANGNYLVLVRPLANGNDEVRRYSFATSSYTLIASSADTLTHPSIDDAGNKVMYLWKRSSDNRYFIRIKDIAANTIATELSSTTALDHPFITADGAFATYQQLISGLNQVRTRNLTSNTVANPQGGAYEYFQPFWMVPEGPACGSGSTITGNVTLTTQSQVDALANASKIVGSLTIASTSDLDLSPLKLLTEITGNFQLDGSSQTTLSGFDCLKTVGGAFFINSNTALTSLSGFAALQTVGGNFSIIVNPALTDMPSFAALTSIGGDFFIDNNAALESTFSSFVALKTVGGGFSMDNSVLNSLPSFTALETVGGLFNIFGNRNLFNISGFAALTSVGSFNIERNSLFFISGFATLTSVGGDFVIQRNDLNDITGFNNLDSWDIAGTATVSNNPDLDCQNPDPHFSPVDVSTGNEFNCFTDFAVAGFAFANEPTNPSYEPDPSYSYNASEGFITANRTAIGTYNIVFEGLTLDAKSNVQVSTAYNPSTGSFIQSYCKPIPSSGTTVQVRCYDGANHVLQDIPFMVAINHKVVSNTAKVTAFALADQSGTASYTPAAASSYNSYGGAITATRSSTGEYQISFASANFTDQPYNFQITALADKAFCVINNFTSSTINVQCFNQNLSFTDSRYSLTVIESGASSTARTVAFATANQPAVASYTPAQAFSQTGGAITATRTSAGTYKINFAGVTLASNYNLQVKAQSNDSNYCVLGPSGPIDVDNSIFVTCYNSLGTKTDTPYSIWVVQK